MANLHILVVDDDETVRLFLEKLLKRRDDDCTLARSGPEALDILQKQQFDVMITDLYMPEMNGLELIKQSRSIAPRLVSIVLTGLGHARRHHRRDQGRRLRFHRKAGA